jgi:glutamate 5-kinase
MASKLAAAKIASWSGVDTVIANAAREDVVADAVAGAPGVGTTVRSRESRIAARKLWIAFAVIAQGRVVVDTGARRALETGKSLLAAGVRSVDGEFDPGSPVEVVDTEGSVFAKGLARHGSAEIGRVAGQRSDVLPAGSPAVVIHADDLVTIPA